MSHQSSPKSRISLLVITGAALLAAAFALGALWQSRSKSEAPRTEPDLTAIREALQTEAAKRLESPLEGRTLTVTLKPGTQPEAIKVLRQFACLPLEGSESRWLFQGSPEEGKRLEEALKSLGDLESAGTPPSGNMLMNITLLGGAS